jgi:hypothetical protein
MDCFVASAPRNDEGGLHYVPDQAIAFISMDCRVIPDPVGDRRPAMTINRRNPSMRRYSARPTLVLLLLAPLLAGCLERGQPTMVNAGGDDDDAYCRANNVAPGSAEYVACRKDRDVQRNAANARTDRRQRDLGEYMMNHPDHP